MASELKEKKMKRIATETPIKMSSLLMGIFFFLLYCWSLDIFHSTENAGSVLNPSDGIHKTSARRFVPGTIQLNEFHRYLRSLHILNRQRINVKKIPNPMGLSARPKG
jgi:hypothetical protein